jgi:ankyrin repeat protein
MIIYRFIFDKGHPERLSNKRSSNGETPLYVASKNGHLNVRLVLWSIKVIFQMVKLLLENEADPYALHKAENAQSENVLDVAVR